MLINTLPKRSSLLDRIILNLILHLLANTKKARPAKFFAFCYWVCSVLNKIWNYFFASKDNGIKRVKDIPPLILDEGPVLKWHNQLDQKRAIIASKDEGPTQPTYIPSYNTTILQFLAEEHKNKANKAPVKYPNSQPVKRLLQ